MRTPRWAPLLVVLEAFVAACTAGPTDESVSETQAIIQGIVTRADGAPVAGAVVQVFQDAMLEVTCTGDYSITSGRDTTDATGWYSLISRTAVIDTICAAVRVFPPDSLGLSEGYLEAVLLPFRYPPDGKLDTVRVDFVLQPQ